MSRAASRGQPSDAQYEGLAELRAPSGFHIPPHLGHRISRGRRFANSSAGSGTWRKDYRWYDKLDRDFFRTNWLNLLVQRSARA